MTALFDAQSFLHKFQFVVLLGEIWIIPWFSERER